MAKTPKSSKNPVSKSPVSKGSQQSNHSIEEFTTFCKKKGFIYPSSDIYGGLAGFYDYGHLGTKLKHN